MASVLGLTAKRDDYAYGGGMNSSERQAEDVRQAVADFKRAMELRGELNLRVARRDTSILRAGDRKSVG